MTQQKTVFPVGNGVELPGAGQNHKRDVMNFGAELRGLAKTLNPHDAELLGSAANRFETLLAETDRLSLLLNDAVEHLGSIVNGTASCLHMLAIDGVTPACSERGGA